MVDANCYFLVSEFKTTPVFKTMVFIILSHSAMNTQYADKSNTQPNNQTIHDYWKQHKHRKRKKTVLAYSSMTGLYITKISHCWVNA